MGDVVVYFIDEPYSKLSFYRCRICHEEETENYFEAPCTCSETIKLSVVLLIKHAYDVFYRTHEYPFTIFRVLTLKAIGILLPMVVIIRTITAFTRSLRYQFLESEENTLSSDEDGLEDEDQQHLV